MLALALFTPAAQELPAAVRAWGPALQPAGTGRLTWLGIRIYDAQLWVEPGFRHAASAQHTFALELHYARAFTAAQVARRSLEEMRRAGPLDDADARRWEQRLAALLPDIQPEDRVLGLHRPGHGAAFVVNGRPAGEIAEPAFAARFFGIWLAPTTSEPKLRAALLANTLP